MFCANCGTQLDDDARFCPECGQPVELAAAFDDSPTIVFEAPTSVLDPEPAPLTQMMPAPAENVAHELAASPIPQKRSVLPVVLAIVAALVIGGGFFGYRAYQAHQEEQAQQLELARLNSEHPVTFVLEVPDAEAVGPIPVQITGTAETGEEVDLAGFLAADGTGVALKNGSYTVHVSASPLASGGVLYQTPADLMLELRGLEVDEAFAVSDDAKLEFVSIAPIDVTDAQLQAAYDSAIAGGMAAETADSYRAGIAAARQEAQAIAAAEAAERERLASLSTIDLSDARDYEQVNLFLSNFVEWPEFVLETWRWDNSFDRERINLEQIANWAMWHLAINNDGVMNVDITKIRGTNGGLGNDIDYFGKDEYPRSVDATLMADIVERYTGVRPDFTTLRGTYQYYEGRVYEGSERGAADALNTVALAKQATPVGDGLFRIDFTAYRYGYSPEVVSDKSWYGLQPEELITAMEAAYSPYSGQTVDTWSGTAVVELTVDGDEASLKLVSMSIS